MASTSSFSIHDFNSLEKEVAEVLLQLRVLTPFSSPFLIRTWFSKGRRSAINVEPSPSPPSSPLLLPPPPPQPSTKVDQEQPETTTSSCLSPNSPLSFPLLSDNIDYQFKNPLKIPMKKKIKIVKDQETSMFLSVPPPPPPPPSTTKITLNPKPSLSFFLPGDNNINNIVKKKPQTSSFSSNNVRKKGLMMISSGQQVRFKQVSNNNPVVTTEFTLGPTTPSRQQKSHLQPLINNINHQITAAGLGQVSVSNTKSYPKCLKAITSIMNTMTSEKTIRMSYNPTISTTTTTAAAISEQTRKRKFEVQ